MKNTLIIIFLIIICQSKMFSQEDIYGDLNECILKLITDEELDHIYLNDSNEKRLYISYNDLIKHIEDYKIDKIKLTYELENNKYVLIRSEAVFFLYEIDFWLSFIDIDYRSTMITFNFDTRSQHYFSNYSYIEAQYIFKKIEDEWAIHKTKIKNLKKNIHNLKSTKIEINE